jgi:hypothetical protein
MSIVRMILDSGVTVAVGTGAWLIGVTAALAHLRAKEQPRAVEQRASIPPRRRR